MVPKVLDAHFSLPEVQCPLPSARSPWYMVLAMHSARCLLPSAHVPSAWYTMPIHSTHCLMSSAHSACFPVPGAVPIVPSACGAHCLEPCCLMPVESAVECPVPVTPCAHGARCPLPSVCSLLPGVPNSWYFMPSACGLWCQSCLLSAVPAPQAPCHGVT